MFGGQVEAFLTVCRTGESGACNTALILREELVMSPSCLECSNEMEKTNQGIMMYEKATIDKLSEIPVRYSDAY
ncbi:hypothetical protein T265_01117 [Opisthorchis viverrini]|uniref:Uncharacterized protein n=1 Tax=Opisthorchis viverrini TaxID=6198 RepID=A0A075AAK7_OPIVI|nr:hypothetical protein T265_01117 [Opisthorchis viverrini]KER32820.1 hypothetical protein T265_01117 [Opisthorchis viverrini]